MCTEETKVEEMFSEYRKQLAISWANMLIRHIILIVMMHIGNMLRACMKYLTLNAPLLFIRGSWQKYIWFKENLKRYHLQMLLHQRQFYNHVSQNHILQRTRYISKNRWLSQNGVEKKKWKLYPYSHTAWLITFLSWMLDNGKSSLVNCHKALNGGWVESRKKARQIWAILFFH